MLVAYILENCPYSTSAYNLIKQKKLNCKCISVPQDEEKKSKLKQTNNMTTFPQILYKNENHNKYHKLGGYNELFEYTQILDQIKNKKLNKKCLIYLLSSK